MLVSRVIMPKKKKLTQPNSDDRLEEWTNTRNTKNQYCKQLRNFLKVSILFFFCRKIYKHLLIWYKKTDSIKELCKPMEMGNNRCWKMGVQETEDSEIEEMVLRFQGIVCNRELPPIRRPFKVYVSLSQLPENNILIPQQLSQ